MSRPSDSAIVYRATNVANGHRYIGMTTQGLRRREYSHRRAARVGGGFSLHAAIRKYGQDSFIFEQLYDFEGDVELALLYESELIDAEKPEYNIVKGDNSWKSPVLVEANRKVVQGVNFKRSNKGQKRTPEQCAAQSENLKKAWAAVRKGFKHTEETKARVSAAKKATPTRYWLGKKRPDQVAVKGLPVMCIDDGRVFPSQSAAAQFYGLDKTSISSVVNGKNKTVGGKVFIRVKK